GAGAGAPRRRPVRAPGCGSRVRPRRAWLRLRAAIIAERRPDAKWRVHNPMTRESTPPVPWPAPPAPAGPPARPVPPSALRVAAARPRRREKLRTRGIDSLSESELLALLLGSGIPGRSALRVARSLARRSPSELAGWPLSRWLRVPGIGPARAS